MTNDELATLSDSDLLRNLIRCVQLNTKSDGNGKNRFDQEQLEKEVLERMNKPPKVYTVEEDPNNVHWQNHE